jgi:hypothetical protein
MLPMRQLIPVFFLFGSVPLVWAQRTTRVNRDPITTRVSILRQSYCRGDADLFTVSLKLKLQAANSSKTPVYVLWPMVPWVGKVAVSPGDAKAGRFLYEITASHYPQEVTRFDRLKIEPGEKVTLQTGYDLIARHDPAFSYPKSLSAGAYTLVLVLSPEEEPPVQMEGPDTLTTITTEPFVVEVSAHPKLVNCESGAKAQ